MTNKFFAPVTVLCIFAAFAGIGCQKQAKKAADAINKQGDALALNDRWATACANVSLDIFNISSSVEEVEFGAAVERKTTLFKEDNCQTPIVSIVEYGSYKIGAQTPAGSRTYELDMRFDSVTITPVNQDGVNALNTVNACGVNDWAIGQARDVTAKTSDNPVLARCWVTTPRNQFNIVNVENDQLKMGVSTTDKDASTLGKRPTELDLEKPFMRQ